MKKLAIYALLVVVTFILNFAIYNLSFNPQATPFLHEEQRVVSGLLMLKTTLPAYFIAAVVIAAMFYWLGKRR
ncbi:hypothetical protein [Arsukibacterium sp.]|uniref:hypothetical protein n=1 Tax=Arsukibacterium sp. TaxID=1977258 RepID=UPI00299EFC94|nr:hypothetical protein [Arsukibacterium sp.]MDX1536542.1 hypothetical protein [Arsukibacterium sp.]